MQNPRNVTDYTASWHYNRYKVRIDRNHKTMYIVLTDSKHNTDKGLRPTKYDILACLQKYDVGTFEDFCATFGHSVGSLESLKLHKDVVREYENVVRLFGDVLDELCEIC